MKKPQGQKEPKYSPTASTLIHCKTTTRIPANKQKTLSLNSKYYFCTIFLLNLYKYHQKKATYNLALFSIQTIGEQKNSTGQIFTKWKNEMNQQNLIRSEFIFPLGKTSSILQV